MQRQNVRVVLASESPQMRSLLSQVIEQESGVEIVGEARNAVDALTLTRNLRPNVVILDCYLPHSVSLHDVPQSRINGLDVAQAISEEIPKTKVMLLNNLDRLTLSGGSLTPGFAGGYCLAIGGTCISIAQWPKARVNADSGDPVFANLTLQEPQAFLAKATSTCDKIIFFGALGFGVGWLLTITIIFAPAGVTLAALGALTAIVGLVGKLVTSLWRKIQAGSGVKRGKEEVGDDH